MFKDWCKPEWRVDAALDKVLKALDESGLADNTLILFTSDHGDGVASHRTVEFVYIKLDIIGNKKPSQKRTCVGS